MTSSPLCGTGVSELAKKMQPFVACNCYYLLVGFAGMLPNLGAPSCSKTQGVFNGALWDRSDHQAAAMITATQHGVTTNPCLVLNEACCSNTEQQQSQPSYGQAHAACSPGFTLQKPSQHLFATSV
jgi:hypothetical protein